MNASKSLNGAVVGAERLKVTTVAVANKYTTLRPGGVANTTRLLLDEPAESAPHGILTGSLGRASLPGMSIEFLLTSLVVILIPGTGVVYTVSSSIGGGRRRGILLNVLNPKLTLFFFAFLPQFLDASPGLFDPRLIGLGGVFMLMTLAVFAIYALASAAARDLVLAAPVARRWVERALGVFLIRFAQARVHRPVSRRPIATFAYDDAVAARHPTIRTGAINATELAKSA